MCDSGPKESGRRGWTSGSLNLPESLLRGPCFCLMGRAPSAKAAASPGCICQLFRADAEVCVYTRKTEERRSLQALATYTCSFTCSLPALILLFSPFSHPAVHPDQTPEPCHQKRVLENPAALNMKTSGKRKIFIWTSLVTGCLD